MDVMDEGRADGTDAEAKRNAGNEPAGADPLACHVRGNLEDDVRDVEDAQDGVVVVVLEV